MIRAILCILCAAIFWSGEVRAQAGRSVALVVSVGDGHARADAIQAQLQVVGTETLRGIDPNNAELRSILTRFAAEALNAEAAVIYLDTPVVLFDGREFVLPASGALRRSSDLFTRAIPLSAFARATELAAVGGAVLVVAGAPPDTAPPGIDRVTTAPEPAPGLSPILIAAASTTDTVVREIAAATRVETVELGAILDRIADNPDITLSTPVRQPILLRAAPPDPVLAAIGVSHSDAAPAEEPAPAETPEPEIVLTLEELIVLERGLTRADRRNVQAGLRREGFYSGFIDGILGPQSRSAITAYQTALGETPTGYLTPSQIDALR